MSFGGYGGSIDTYEVVVAVDDSRAVASIDQIAAKAQNMDRQFTAAVSQMRAAMAQMSAQSSRQLSEVPDSFAGIGRNAGTATSAIGRLVSSLGLLSVGREIVSGMRDAFSDLRTYTEKLNADLVTMQSRLAEVQSITGRAGGSQREVIQEHLDVMKYTGMTSQQAAEFTGEFVGEAEVSREKFRPDQYAQIQRQSARFAMIHGGPASAHAILAGRLAGFYRPVPGQEDRQAEDIMTQQANLYAGMNLAPGMTAAVNQSVVTAMSRLVSPTGKGGMVGSPEALVNLAVAGAKPAGDPSSIDTFLEQFARGVTGQSRSKQWTSFLRDELRIPAEAPAEVAMGPIFKRLEEVQARGQSLSGYLKDVGGLSSSEERRAIVGMFENRDLYEAARTRRRLSPEQARRQLEDPYTLGTDAFRGNLALGREQAGLQAVQIEQAQMNQTAEIFRTRAVAQLTQQNRIGPTWQAGLGAGERLDQMLTNAVLGKDFVERQLIDQTAAQLYEQQTGRILPGHAQFNREGPGLWKQMTGISHTFVNEEYVLANQFSADVNASESGRRLGFDAATGARTGKALVDEEMKKAILDTRDHTRKDRPMTVAKPAPKPRP